MSLLASPLESVESAVIWLLVGFSVVTWGLALVKVVQFVRLKNQDKRFHQQFCNHLQQGANHRAHRAFRGWYRYVLYRERQLRFLVWQR